jgi:hypothetical protein
MKKLISVFAAMALVGSVAAAPKKPAPKVPAKPVVAAPAAVSTAVAMAPAVHKAGKGIGLFIEGRGTYTLGQGTSSSAPTGDTATNPVTYKLPNTSAWGGGATIGFEFVQGLAIVASYDYRAMKSRTWDVTNSGVAGFTQSASNTTNTQVLGIGFRPSIHALGGVVYAGMGFAYVLPYDSVTTINYANGAAAGINATSYKATSSLNAGIGVYGELGYNFHITDNLYIGLGIRATVATANNDGKSTTTVTDGSIVAVSSPTGAAIASGTTTVNYASSKDATQAGYTSTGITDAGININLGLRF